MKLELKHLAPYLPYDLNCLDGSGNTFVVCYFNPKSQPFLVNIGDLIFKKTNIIKSQRYRPILRPLSDLTKEIEVNGGWFTPIDFLEDFIDWNHGYKTIEYWKIQKMFEWHFDVFGLIEKGLAIDINTLENN